MMVMVPGTCGAAVSYLPPIGVNSTTTVMPAATACLTGFTTAVPSFACTIITSYRLDVTASCSWLTCVGPSKFESRKVASALLAAAYSCIPDQVAWANEFALAKPKKPMLSFLSAGAAVAAPPAVEVSGLLQPATATTAVRPTARSRATRITGAPRVRKEGVSRNGGGSTSSNTPPTSGSSSEMSSSAVSRPDKEARHGSSTHRR